MRRSACVLVMGVAMAASTAFAADDTEREGPFVLTEKTLGALLDDGFEVKGMLGSEIVVVKQAELYSCSRVADHEAMTYKPYFACWKLDEVAPDGGQGTENKAESPS